MTLINFLTNYDALLSYSYLLKKIGTMGWKSEFCFGK